MAKGLCQACYQRQWRVLEDRHSMELERHRRYRNQHQDRLNADSRERRAKNHSAGRDYWLRSTYGLTLEEYNILHESQAGLCAVCHKPETRHRHGKVLPLVVDHCHVTNQFRGLLCHACNVSLGLLSENPDRMRALARYIEKAKS
jgi:hypothetical protein